MTAVAAAASERLDGLVLVRLLVPATSAKARDDVGKITGRQDPGEWAITFAAVWGTGELLPSTKHGSSIGQRTKN